MTHCVHKQYIKTRIVWTKNDFDNRILCIRKVSENHLNHKWLSDSVFIHVPDAMNMCRVMFAHDGLVRINGGAPQEKMCPGYTGARGESWTEEGGGSCIFSVASPLSPLSPGCDLESTFEQHVTSPKDLLMGAFPNFNTALTDLEAERPSYRVERWKGLGAFFK